MQKNSIRKSLTRETKQSQVQTVVNLLQRFLGTQCNAGSHFFGIIVYEVSLVPRNSNTSMCLSFLEQ